MFSQVFLVVATFLFFILNLCFVELGLSSERNDSDQQFSNSCLLIFTENDVDLLALKHALMNKMHQLRPLEIAGFHDAALKLNIQLDADVRERLNLANRAVTSLDPEIENTGDEDIIALRGKIKFDPVTTHFNRVSFETLIRQLMLLTREDDTPEQVSVYSVSTEAKDDRQPRITKDSRAGLGTEARHDRQTPITKDALSAFGIRRGLYHLIEFLSKGPVHFRLEAPLKDLSWKGLAQAAMVGSGARYLTRERSGDSLLYLKIVQNWARMAHKLRNFPSTHRMIISEDPVSEVRHLEFRNPFDRALYELSDVFAVQFVNNFNSLVVTNGTELSVSRETLQQAVGRTLYELLPALDKVDLREDNSLLFESVWLSLKAAFISLARDHISENDKKGQTLFVAQVLKVFSRFVTLLKQYENKKDQVQHRKFFAQTTYYDLASLWYIHIRTSLKMREVQENSAILEKLDSEFSKAFASIPPSK